MEDDPFSFEDLARAAAELPIILDDATSDEFDQLKVYLAGFQAEKYYQLFKDHDITEHILPYLTGTVIWLKIDNPDGQDRVKNFGPDFKRNPKYSQVSLLGRTLKTHLFLKFSAMTFKDAEKILSLPEVL